MNSQIRFTALIVALLLGTAACTHNSDSPAEITGKTADCNKLKSSIPKDFIQGTVEVPEDYDHPEGQKIHVFYYGRVGTAENPTIVFFNGGPVSDSHGSWQSPTRITDQSEEAKKIWPMIFIDQRGTGCSSEFPRLQSEAEYIRYAHWGSKEIVKDAEVIRKKIQGGLRWKVFGQSYGGFITQRYLQIAPEGIRSMHVHGFTSGRDIDLWMAGRLKSQHVLMAEFFSENPGDETVFNKVESLLTDAMCVGTGNGKTCGKRILYSLTGALGFHYTWPFIHSTINGFLNDQGVDQVAIAKYAETMALMKDHTLEDQAGLVVGWVDMGDHPFTYLYCTKIYEILRKSGEKPETWPLTECKGSMLSGPEIAEEQSLNSILASIPQNVLTLEKQAAAHQEHAGIPFFLYSGAKDTYVPAANFADEVKLLGTLVHYESFPNSGHEGFYTEQDVWTNLTIDHSLVLTVSAP